MENLAEFGSRVKQYRSLKKESLQDVAHALDIDHSYLSRLETGQRKPSYPILVKLISHFSLSGAEAIAMASLSGYGSHVTVSDGNLFFPKSKTNASSSQENSNRKEVKKIMENPVQSEQPQAQIIIPTGTTVQYTDSCWVTETPYGIVMDFAQTVGSTNQQNVVARVGMSVEHAEAIVKVLSQKIVESKLKVKQKKERASEN